MPTVLFSSEFFATFDNSVVVSSVGFLPGTTSPPSIEESGFSTGFSSFSLLTATGSSLPEICILSPWFLASNAAFIRALPSSVFFRSVVTTLFITSSGVYSPSGSTAPVTAPLPNPPTNDSSKLSQSFLSLS